VLIDPNAPADRPETAQMVVIHRALRREFGLLPGLIASSGPAGPLIRHLNLLLLMLHEHHEAEDELLWPALHRRAPREADDLIAAMTSQHAAVAAAVDRASGSPDEKSLRELYEVLAEHLDFEESTVLPLIHEHLTVDEWLAPQKHAMKNGPKSLTDKLLLAGVVLEDASPRERAWFLSEMPPPARLLWRLIGARRYAERVRAVRG
jgi:hypothetical protein